MQIDSRDLQRLHTDWSSWRNGREFPSRRDFSAHSLQYLLGRLNLIDVLHHPLRFRWRLHGSEVVRHVGRDLTGRFAHEDDNLEFRARVYLEYGRTVEERAPSRFAHFGILDGRAFNYELIVLPLSEDGAVINMLLVGFEFGPFR